MNDDELREEIESHLRMRAEHNSISPAEARKRFGNSTQIQEEMRSMHISVFADQLRQDLGYALRRMARQPGFTFAVIATIALGVGAASAVFSVVDRILFRSLPFASEEQLVWLGMTAPLASDEFLLGGDYFDWREQQTAFTHLTASAGGSCDITETQRPEHVRCLRIAHDYLAAFGIHPHRGRSFTKDEDRHDGQKSVMISHALWRTRYNAAEDVLNKTLEINGVQSRIVGVLPPDFEVPNLQQVDLAVPLALNETQQRSRKSFMMFVNGWARLKPGVSIDQARTLMQPVFENSLQYVPKAFVKEVKLNITSLRERQARDSRATSLALLGAVLCVLIIACANVMNLFLARATASAREFWIREAIGASRFRLTRQNLTESMLLCFTGGISGLVLAYWFLQTAIVLAPSDIPRMADASLDLRVVCFALVLTIAAGFISGLRIEVPARSWTRPALVTLQIALAGALLYATALLGESLWKMQSVPLGVTTDRLLTTRIELPSRKPDVRAAFWTQLQQRIAALPGVEAQTLSDSLPPNGSGGMIFSRISVDGKPEDLSAGTGGMACVRTIAPGFFEALRIPVLKGRSFEPMEPESIILSERIARRLFNGSIDVLGHKIRPGTGETWRTVVGVVGNVHNKGIESGDPEYYLPLSRERDAGGLILTVRTSGEPERIIDLIRTEIHALDAHLPLKFETMQQITGKLTARPRFSAAILAFFSLAGLFIGATGVYAVVSFLISQRSKEIAVRMAVGASASQIRRMILSTSLQWAVAGMLGSAAVLSVVLPLIRNLLYRTAPTRPWLIVTVLVAIGVVVIAASLPPARRAARSDPMPALRQD